MNRSVTAVVVTHNRKYLLAQCLQAILTQSISVANILVVDNAGDDNSECFIKSQTFWDEQRIKYVRLSQNIGGAGGFAHGIQMAMSDDSSNWLWLMDDDCEPSEHALAELLYPVDQAVVEKIGFVCGKVLWSDKSAHKMNLPDISPLINGVPFNRHDEDDVLLVKSCSFVSVLVNPDAVCKVGLPLRQMFIWGDDVEFFHRMTRVGWLGLYARKSAAVHHTRKNENSTIYSIADSELWKYRYGVRNQLFHIRREKGWLPYFKVLLSKLVVQNIKILAKRKDHQLRAVLDNSIGCLSSLLFFPAVECCTDKNGKSVP